MTSIYEKKKKKKNPADVQLIHAEKMSSYNFIILRKKETPTQVFSYGFFQTFNNSGGYF